MSKSALPIGVKDSPSNTKPMGVAVIGCGYWGTNYVRIFNELTESRVVEDSNVVRTPIAATDYSDAQGFCVGGTIFYSNWKSGLAHSAPLLERTAGSVRNRIFRSSHNDALWM